MLCKDCNYLKHTRTGKEFMQFVYQYAQRFLQVTELANKESQG